MRRQTGPQKVNSTGERPTSSLCLQQIRIHLLCVPKATIKEKWLKLHFQEPKSILAGLNLVLWWPPAVYHAQLHLPLWTCALRFSPVLPAFPWGRRLWPSALSWCPCIPGALRTIFLFRIAVLSGNLWLACPVAHTNALHSRQNM